VAKLYTTIWLAPFRVSVTRLLPRGPIAVGAAMALAAAQIRLLSGSDLLAALDAVVRWGVGAWVVATLVAASWSAIRGGPPSRPTGDTRLAMRVLLITCVLLIAALLRAPHRLVVNLLGFALLGAPLVWLVRRRAGERAAAWAAIAFGVLVFTPTHLDVRAAPQRAEFDAESGFRWAVGWPDGEWVLSHQMVLARPLGNAALSLYVQRAGFYSGAAAVEVTLNGERVGTLQNREQDWLAVALPVRLTAGQTALLFELREDRLDPLLRLVAQRWSGGATAGAAASRYFDGTSWHGGTLNAATGRPEGGMYVLQLRGDLWR